MFNNLGTSNMGSNNLGTSTTGSNHLVTSNMASNILGTSNLGSNSLGAQHLAVPSNNLAAIAPNPGNPGLQHVTVPNNKLATIAPNPGNPGSQHMSASNKRSVQMISGPPNKSGSQKLSAANKRGPKESTPSSVASQRLSVPGKRQTQMEPSPKAQAESFESVRAKMRESLASALAMVSEEQNKTVEKNSQSEAPSTSKPSIEDPQVSESTSATVDIASSQMPEKPMDHLSSKDHDCAQSVNEGQNAQNPSQDSISIKDDVIQAPKFDGQEFQFKYALLDEDVSFGNNFFAKDDLLQGNGLCWASDLDIEIIGERESHDAKRQKLENEVGGDNGDQASHCPQTLATKIEAELFKVFGGVNKKYKEKGRSLLFNLKDPNNPELRERVISGEISPERLCSMTAEELASKELSEWRIAKAEELAQMVVLPDSEVDIRRLVRKTHKGEFQVEFEQDDSVSVEVTVGASSLSQFPPRTKEPESQSPSKPDETVKAKKSEITISEKVNIDDQSRLDTLPSDGTDLMQGLMMDEMKDAEFLPPIVSLDEFMESLDSEPPFENLQMVAGANLSVSEEKKSSDIDSKVEASDHTSKDPVTAASDKSDKLESKDMRADHNLKSGKILESETPLNGAAAKGEHVWEGILQLNISSMVTVRCYFKSGEKTSAKEWPNFLDIKGRVKLDAFEKFLQELPMSRSRAIMVVHFCWKEDSPESGRESLREVVDSYVADERVGFAEPAPAVELYFCPPHVRTIEMLGKHLPKDHIDTLNALDNGLIGIVVWRKAHVSSTISPNSSSHHHKHSSKKQNHLRRQQEEKDTSTNANPHTASASILGPPPTRNPKLQLHDEPIDDIPPGFGPGSVKEDDDLPEFEFASGSNQPVSQFSTPKPSLPPRASFAPGQTRELIQKYGHNEMSTNNKRLNWQQQSQSAHLEVQPWNDDDDIPEWQPQQQITPPPPPPPAQHLQLTSQLVHGFQQQTVPPHMVGALPQQQSPHGPLVTQQFTQQNLSMQPLQPPMNMIPSLVGHQNTASPWQAGASWPPQTGSNGHTIIQQQGNNMIQPCNNNNSNISGQTYEGQFYGTPPYGIGTRQRQGHVSRNGSGRGF